MSDLHDRLFGAALGWAMLVVIVGVMPAFWIFGDRGAGIAFAVAGAPLMALTVVGVFWTAIQMLRGDF